MRSLRYLRSSSNTLQESGVPVTITLKNTGNAPISLVVRSAWLDHILSLEDERGNKVPETAHAAATKDGAEAGRRAIRRLAPGETISDTIELEKVFRATQTRRLQANFR